MDISDSMDVKKRPLFQRLKHLFSTDIVDRPTTNYTVGPSTTFNSSVLQDAIADAKAVRQTALANAKNALNSAFYNSYPFNSQSTVPPISMPGYSIAFSSEPVDHFKDEVGNFDTRDDFVGAISGFCIPSGNVPPSTGKNALNAGYVYAPYIPSPIQSLRFGRMPALWTQRQRPIRLVNDAMEKSKKVLDKSMNKSASYATPSFAHTNKSASYISSTPHFATTQSYVDPKYLPPKSDGSGAIGQSSPLTRTGNIATVGFDVIIGRPQFSRQINAIDYNGEKIPLERYRDKIRMAINDFHKHITDKYGDEKPKYKISYGPMFDDKEIELTFTGLMFDNFKIIATFSYEGGRLKCDIDANKNLMALLNEVGRNCEFFVTGDIEFDELHVLITEMKLESFNYNNRNNPGFNNVLFSI